MEISFHASADVRVDDADQSALVLALLGPDLARSAHVNVGERVLDPAFCLQLMGGILVRVQKTNRDGFYPVLDQLFGALEHVVSIDGDQNRPVRAQPLGNWFRVTSGDQRNRLWYKKIVRRWSLNLISYGPAKIVLQQPQGHA